MRAVDTNCGQNVWALPLAAGVVLAAGAGAGHCYPNGTLVPMPDDGSSSTGASSSSSTPTSYILLGLQCVHKVVGSGWARVSLPLPTVFRTTRVPGVPAPLSPKFNAPSTRE